MISAFDIVMFPGLFVLVACGFWMSVWLCVTICRSVLENHHLYTAFKIMRGDGNNILQDFNYSQRLEFRRYVIELVLATDFAFHIKYVSQFKTLLSAMPSDEEFTAKDDKLLLWRIIIKVADLGHCGKPLKQHRKWSYRAMEEMYRQVSAHRSGDFYHQAAALLLAA